MDKPACGYYYGNGQYCAQDLTHEHTGDELELRDDIYDPDCPACLRDINHTRREHNLALRRARAL